MAGKGSKQREYFAFRVPPKQRRRIEKVIAAIRSDSTPRAHAEALIEIVLELTEVGMEAYYVSPLERVGAGPIMLSAARLGVGAAEKTLPPLVRRIVRSLSDQQLRDVAEIVDEMLV